MTIAARLTLLPGVMPLDRVQFVGQTELLDILTLYK